MSKAPSWTKGRPSLSRFLWLNFSVVFLSFSSALLSQELMMVTEENEPIAGVEVFTSDFDFAVVSDARGMVDLSDWDKTGQLTIRSLGYQEQQLELWAIVELSYKIVLIPDAHHLSDVVVYGRSTRSVRDVAQQIESISASEISSTQPQTAADALSQHGGVYVQKSQMGGGSPVIRGFEANRVLLVVDGVRMNNAIYRNGHLQNAITVDPAILERTDIIFGPNSLLYGSDALGGVIHFQSKSPNYAAQGQKLFGGSAYVRYASANTALMSHVDTELSTDRWSWINSVTFSDFGDLRTGGRRSSRYPDFGKRVEYQVPATQIVGDAIATNPDPNVQIGTGYSQWDLLQKIGYKISQDQQLQLNLQYSTSSNVPRYDNLTEYGGDQIKWAQWYYGPQRRLMGSLRYMYTRSQRLYDDLSVIVAVQRVDEDRYSRRYGRDKGQSQNEDISVYDLSIDLTKLLNDRYRLDYGAGMQFNYVTSTASVTGISGKPIEGEALTRYANGPNQYYNIGAFVLLSEVWGDVHWNAGLRYSHTGYRIQYKPSSLVDWPREYVAGLSSGNHALTGSIGATAQLGDNWSINGLLSTAFRAPNIDDLNKIRIKNNEITFPNTALTPEQSINAEFSIRKKISNRIDLSATVFGTRLRDAIVRDNYVTPAGERMWITQGDTLSVVASQNIGRAVVYGISTQIEWRPSEQWKLRGSYNWTKGRDTEKDKPLGHIPPAYGDLSISYDHHDLQLQYVSRYNLSKPLTEYGGSVDNPDKATAEGSLAWMTHNVYANYALSERWKFSAGIENIMDTHYRPFASGVSAPGRNLTLGLSLSF